MKYYLILVFCFVGLMVDAQKLSIENNSQQSDSSIQIFKNYLIDKKAINPNHQTVLRIYDYHLGMDPMNLEIAGYDMRSSIFKNFSSAVKFSVTDSSTNLSYEGIVLEKQVFVSTIQFFNFNNPYLIERSIENRYNKVLKAHYPKCTLDTIYSSFVNNENGEYIGEFHTEYKTLTRHGCLVTEYYSIIPQNSFTALENSSDCEPVIVFYTGASEEFFIKGKCIGDRFEMYDRFNHLIHKGVASRYLESYIEVGK